MSEKDGIIKFNLVWEKKALPASLNITELVLFRNKLYRLELIGVNKQGIGFGNISVFHKDTGKIIISGSGTGKIKLVNKNHFSMLESVVLKTNTVKCKGVYAASSESMTHYAIYKLSKKINCVIHVHNSRLWKKLKDILPTTNENVTYGTLDMANEIKRLWKTKDLSDRKTIVMSGHRDGIIVFGNNIKETFELITGHLLKYRLSTKK